MNNDFLYLTKRQQDGGLSSGKMTERHFWLLAEVVPIHSEKVIRALRDFLVLGYTRREACERHNVSLGYFSGALGRFQRVNQTISLLTPFYMNGAGSEKSENFT